ncbi:PDR/VanB family oxidoreductase [Aldersonia sp. NBC_00410]|uniref:PDR/VanB family oxidoreductase n=1 Tax=Aldersonia sp. NBC_00410 TaxID=2975954 RepID=UPI002252CE8E|nr:PDR/VanB family oxidoreductase [Aldersonia sp. NBC_00410]MCX5044330.1 PDR/VanB family oxidoreductase [Aldersonia sp. NBC_00410]
MTAAYTPPAALRLVGTAVDAYLDLFVSGRTASLLSRPSPVRHNDFDFPVVVDRIEDVAEGVAALTMSAPSGAELPRWRPGSHVDVFLPSGLQRRYSLCGDLRDRTHYRIAVRHLPDGAGSTEIHRAIEPGMPLRLRGPRNAFEFVDAPAYLFIAGGIGITPILPMARAAALAGARWHLVYLGRSRATMPFLDELVAMGPESVTIRPDDEYGAPEIEALLGMAESGAAVYVCGPPPVLERAQLHAFTANPSGSLHTERFSAATVLDGAEFDLVLARSGTTIRVGADEPALAAIRRAVPGAAYSCRQGFCGTCRVAVLAGEVDHRDRTLTDSERSTHMLSCVSRAAGKSLTLDL